MILVTLLTKDNPQKCISFDEFTFNLVQNTKPQMELDNGYH